MELTAALNTVAQIQEEVWFHFIIIFFLLEFRQTLQYLHLTQQLLKKMLTNVLAVHIYIYEVLAHTK